MGKHSRFDAQGNLVPIRHSEEALKKGRSQTTAGTQRTEKGHTIRKGFRMGDMGFRDFQDMLKKGWEELYFSADYYWAVIDIPKRQIFSYTEGDTALLTADTLEDLMVQARAYVKMAEDQFGQSAIGEWSEVEAKIRNLIVDTHYKPVEPAPRPTQTPITGQLPTRKYAIYPPEGEMLDYITARGLPLSFEWDEEEKQKILVVEVSHAQYKKLFAIGEEIGGWITPYQPKKSSPLPSNEVKYGRIR